MPYHSGPRESCLHCHTRFANLNGHLSRSTECQNFYYQHQQPVPVVRIPSALLFPEGSYVPPPAIAPPSQHDEASMGEDDNHSLTAEAGADLASLTSGNDSPPALQPPADDGDESSCAGSNRDHDDSSCSGPDRPSSVGSTEDYSGGHPAHPIPLLHQDVSTIGATGIAVAEEGSDDDDLSSVFYALRVIHLLKSRITSGGQVNQSSWQSSWKKMTKRTLKKRQRRLPRFWFKPPQLPLPERLTAPRLIPSSQQSIHNSRRLPWRNTPILGSHLIIQLTTPVISTWFRPPNLA